MNPYIETEDEFGAQNYEPLPVVITRGEGVYVWDEQGKRYLDLMSAYSAVSLGHCHPGVIKALQTQSVKLNVISRAFYSDQLGRFLQKACELTGYEKALPMNTGAEAVETALKAARKWGYQKKGIPKDQAEIIVCAGNFHGRTITIVSMSTEAQYQHGFGPLTPGFKVIPYGDVNALKAAITPNTAAFLVEPVQGEAGIVVPPAGYLKACAEICKENNVLLICDEIQTGLGRTGKLLACQHDDVKPDAIVLGKALGGGVLPVSLFLTTNEVMNVFKPGDHGSTFGGNPLAASVGTAALTILLEENLIARAAEMGDYFKKQLEKLHSPLIKAIRGKGLLLGIEVDAQYPARQICLALLQQGVLTKETHATVIRLAPPLTITKEQIDFVVEALKKVFAAATIKQPETVR